MLLTILELIDGRINYEEFCAMMRSGMPQQRYATNPLIGFVVFVVTY